jgi:hypothetical protein
MKPQGITSSQWFRFNLYFTMEHFLGLENFNRLAGKSRKALYDEIDAQLKNSNRGEILPTPNEYEDLTQKQMKEKYFHNISTPVVFKGAANNWNCVKTWSFDFFKDNYGDKEVSLNDNVGIVDRDNPQKYETMTFAEYIDELKRGSGKYLKFSRIMDDDSTLRGDFDLNWLRKFALPGSVGEQFLMFMGNSESMTPIHAGFANTIFVQITGKKRWIMWAPNERIFFDPRAERRPYNYTNADPHKLDDPNFPLFKYARRYEILLEPGDVLYFPSHLWHQVENVEGGTSVAYKIVHIPTSIRSSLPLTLLFFLATKPNLFLDVFYHKVKKRDYIFTRSHAEIA